MENLKINETKNKKIYVDDKKDVSVSQHRRIINCPYCGAIFVPVKIGTASFCTVCLGKVDI